MYFSRLQILFDDSYMKHGNSEIGTRVWSEIGNFTCLRHLFRSTEDMFSCTRFIVGRIFSNSNLVIDNLVTYNLVTDNLVNPIL